MEVNNVSTSSSMTTRPKVKRLTLRAVGLRLLLPLLLLEFHVPIMHHSAGKLVDGDFLFVGEAQDISGHLVTLNPVLAEANEMRVITQRRLTSVANSSSLSSMLATEICP